ncbi:glycosyltransferase [Candidatus Dojkabacteria bacterium]|uniref:Glycosyltransferase n=1 Tax=Candidatus Dojkabacteria bacterium TaxID=2099670 RepID=A0A955L0B2_9BACT|nr:glycosyltransferase [Candidatus Dojkabacteria bacterium]
MRDKQVALIIPTLDRPENIERLLDSLRSFGYLDREGFTPVVVDSSKDSSTKQVTISSGAEYLDAKNLGKSEAMNIAIGHLPFKYIAFLDDDIIIINDSWLDNLLQNFAQDESIGYVSGRVVAAEIKTEAQRKWEQKGALNKGAQRIEVGSDFFQRFYLHGLPVQIVTMGANHIAKREVLTHVQGHDERFGPGQVIGGAGADLDLTYKVLMNGYRIIYDPTAVVAHSHPESLEELRSKLFTYGISDTAIHMKFLLEFGDARSLFQIAYRPGQNAIRLIKSLLGKYPLPPDILLAGIIGNLIGPYEYMKYRKHSVGGITTES